MDIIERNHFLNALESGDEERCWSPPLGCWPKKKEVLLRIPLKAGPLFTSRNKFIFASSRALFSALQAKGFLKYWRASSGGDNEGAEGRGDLNSEESCELYIGTLR